MTTTYQSNLPRTRTRVASRELREQFNPIAQHHRDGSSPGTAKPAQMRGSENNFPVNLTTAFNLNITVDGVANTVDCSGADPANTTLAEIVTAINTAFGSTVADDYDGYLRITSLITTGASSVIIGGSAFDAIEEILRLRPSGATPYVFSRILVPDGVVWDDISRDDDYWMRLKEDRVATIIGSGVSFPVDLRGRRRLKINVDGITQEIIITGASQSAVTLLEIVTAINTAFGASSLATADGGQLRISGADLASDGTAIVEFLRPGRDDATDVILGDAAFKVPFADCPQEYVPFVKGAQRRPHNDLWGDLAPTADALPTGSVPKQHLSVRMIERPCPVPHYYDIFEDDWNPAVPKAGCGLEFDEELIEYRAKVGTEVGDLIQLIECGDPNKFSDNFNRADTGAGGGIGSNAALMMWSQEPALFPQSPRMRILGNQAIYLDGDQLGVPAQSDQEFAVLSAGAAAPFGLASNEMDVWAKVKISSDVIVGTNEALAGMIARADPTNPQEYYYCSISDTGNLRIYKRLFPGGVTQIANTFVDPLDETFRVLRLRVTDSGGSALIEVFWDGSSDSLDFVCETPALSVVDASIPTGAFPGMMSLAQTGRSVIIEDWCAQRAGATSNAGLPAVSGCQLTDIVNSICVVRTGDQAPIEPPLTGTVYLKTDVCDGILYKQSFVSGSVPHTICQYPINTVVDANFINECDPLIDSSLQSALSVWAASVFTRVGFAHPTTWCLNDILRAMVTKLVAGQPPWNPQPGPGPIGPGQVQPWEVVDSLIDPGDPYDSSYPFPDVFFMYAQPDEATLNTIANTGFPAAATPPEGVLSLALATTLDPGARALFVYNGSGPDSWTALGPFVPTAVGEVGYVGDVFIDGKLTVTGLIDPTGMNFVHQVSVPGGTPASGSSTLWVDAAGVLFVSDEFGASTPISGGGGGSTTFTEQEFIATAAQTVFTLSTPYTGAGGLSIVFINHLVYAEGTDYTISGTTLTWLNNGFALVAGDTVTIKYTI